MAAFAGSKDRTAALEELTTCLPSGRVITGAAALLPYSADEGTDAVQGKPVAVVLPSSTAEASAALRWAGLNRIPVVPRDAETGLSDVFI